MAEIDIVQNMISQLGQSQGGRMPKALRTDFVKIDERTPEDLLRFAKHLAPLVNYYRNTVAAPAGNWANFFSYADDPKTLASVREGGDARTSPHLALFLSFLELYRQPQAIINRFTSRHLDFYYHEVLRLGKKPAVPDKAHLLLELKKLSPPIVITPGNVFSAGKDKSRVELLYAPTSETVINLAKVDSLRSIFVDTSGYGAVHYAPIANSSNGLGAQLPEDDPKWRGFGHANLPFAEVGFALAGPVLRMKEGLRKIAVKLRLTNLDATKFNPDALAGAFEVFLTGEKGWQGPYPVLPALNGNAFQFDLTVPENDKAVVDYDQAIHGYSYTAQAPIMQVLLKWDGARIGYNDFKNITLQEAQISVDVANVISLNLENEGGALDAKKAFQPFGAEPTLGSRFMIGYDEAFSKKLSEVAVKVHWKGAPPDFAVHYSSSTYAVPNVDNDYFTATASFKDGGGWETADQSVALFESANASAEHIISFAPGSSLAGPVTPTAGMDVYALRASNRQWAAIAATEFVKWRPMWATFTPPAVEPRLGFITLSLDKDFLHSTYRKKYVEYVIKQETGNLASLNEPYTPAIDSIALSYKAHSDDVSVGSVELRDFSNLDVQFFQLSYFGQMHEHAYQRSQFSFLADKSVSLLPVYDNEGELLIGLSQLNPRDSVSMLFEVAEGSANPELVQEPIVWSVLCDNYWKKLGSDEVLLDTTNQLRVSGVIKFVIPGEATTDNTILPADHIWLRAGVTGNVAALSQLTDVKANAIEVQFRDQGNDPEHLSGALEAGKIAKLKNGVASVKTVKQPYASFGGAAAEGDDDFYRRISERLRHKDRCITAWDYERIILEAFPRVHQVKCIPHAKEGGWLAPSCVLIVVVPDLRNKNAMDPLQPKVDADTISRITELVRRRTGTQVQLKVKNPSYQRIQLDFKVKFRSGYEFNHYSGELKNELIEFLSPWVVDSARDISFGGKIYKSVLLDFVEEWGPVDYVTDFKMYSNIEGQEGGDVNEAYPAAPDSILVSDYTHIVNKAD